jgi:hypothetical protein
MIASTQRLDNPPVIDFGCSASPNDGLRQKLITHLKPAKADRSWLSPPAGYAYEVATWLAAMQRCRLKINQVVVGRGRPPLFFPSSTKVYVESTRLRRRVPILLQKDLAHPNEQHCAMLTKH